MLFRDSFNNNLLNIVDKVKTMKLKKGQAALVLEIDEHGEVEVNVASGDHESLTAKICEAIAEKLMGDEDFQEEIMSMLDDE